MVASPRTTVPVADGSWLDPELRDRLAARGVPPDPASGETPGRFRERLATELMALFRDSRCPHAFDHLYRLTRGDVVRWIRGAVVRCAPRLDPQEMLQDTFVNVYLYAGRFRVQHTGSFRVWVRTIGANAVRRAGSRLPRASLQPLVEASLEPADRRPGPGHQVVLVEERERLALAWTIFLVHYLRAYDGLKPRDARALELVEVRRESYAEAARLLGVGPSNMKMIVFRSRRRILARMRAGMGCTEPVAGA